MPCMDVSVSEFSLTLDGNNCNENQIRLYVSFIERVLFSALCGCQYKESSSFIFLLQHYIGQVDIVHVLRYYFAVKY